MDSRMRLTFACGTCLGLAIGFAAGHVSFWNRLAARMPVSHSEQFTIGPSGLDLPALEPISDPPLPTPSPGGAVVLNDPDLGDEPVHADAVAETPGSPPSTFRAGDARPLKPISKSVQQAQQTESQDVQPLDPEVVEMLKDELKSATDQQREVWADALRGMTPEDAAGVILMWKKFGQAGSTANHSSSAPPLFSSSHPGLSPTPGPSLEAILTAPQPSEAPDIASSIHAHNQANRETCGYLNLVPIQRDLGLDPGVPHAESCGYRLDVRSGRQVVTGNPSHVVVQNGGFLAIQLTTGEIQYTRVGRLVLDSERRLCVDLGDRDLPISPEVKLPEGAYQLTDNQGAVAVLVHGQDQPVSLPQLQMATFFDASRLQSMGGGLYSSTIASGAARMIPAVLMLGTLEFPAEDPPAVNGTRRGS